MNLSIATLISVYGGDAPPLLAAALDSILAQQFTRDVTSRIYLAIDGPVSDDMERVIFERSDRIHRIVRIGRNGGLARALNSLIVQLNDEDFVFRMDADDVSLPTRYQTQLDRFQCDPPVHILGTDIVEHDEATGCKRLVSFAHDHEDAIAKLSWRVPVAHPTVCFRREVLRAVPAYPTTGTNEDVAMWFRCAHAGFRFANVHEPLLEFRISSNFWRRRSVGKAFSELRCYFGGIWLLEGVTWKYVLPILRFGLRLAPLGVVKWAYKSTHLRPR